MYDISAMQILECFEYLMKIEGYDVFFYAPLFDDGFEIDGVEFCD